MDRRPNKRIMILQKARHGAKKQTGPIMSSFKQANQRPI